MKWKELRYGHIFWSGFKNYLILDQNWCLTLDTYSELEVYSNDEEDEEIEEEEMYKVFFLPGSLV